MTETTDHRDPHWVHRDLLHSVASWILVVAAAFTFNGVWTFAREHSRAVKDVRIVRDSGVQRIYHDGRVQSRDEIVRMILRRPWWATLPFALLAVLMGGCAWLAFRRPVPASGIALFVAVLGGVAYLTRDGRWDALSAGFFVVQWLLLTVGIRSAVGWERVQRSRSSRDDVAAT